MGKPDDSGFPNHYHSQSAYSRKRQKRNRVSRFCKRCQFFRAYREETRYHIYQEILKKIRDKEAQEAIRALFDNERIGEMLRYIRIYADSAESPDGDDKASRKAKELYKYLNNNREGLLPYDKRGIEIHKEKRAVDCQRLLDTNNKEIILDRKCSGRYNEKEIKKFYQEDFAC